MGLRFKCWIGMHDWKIEGPSPSPFPLSYEQTLRVCQCCGKRQAWLPGYGGSEIGCWLNEKAAATLNKSQGMKQLRCELAKPK